MTNNADKPARPFVEPIQLCTVNECLSKREELAATMNHDATVISFDDEESIVAFLGIQGGVYSAIDLSFKLEAKLRVMRADALLSELAKEDV